MPRNLEQPLMEQSFLDQLLSRTREREMVLGDLCKFEVKDLEIAPTDLFDMLKKYGLEKWTPVDIRPKTAARKAVTRVRKMLEDPESDLRVIVRPVHTKEQDVVRYAIIDEQTDHGELDLDFTTRNQVVFRKDTDSIEFTKEEVPEILQQFDYLCSVYTDAEIGRMVHNIVTNHGVLWMQDRSGMFFVPHLLKEKLADPLIALFNEFREASEQSYFRAISIMDDAENRATMGEALIADITVELNEATRALDHAVGEESTRSMNAALNRFKIASGKAKLYEDMLQLNLRDIQERVNGAHKKAGELVMKLAAVNGDGSDD